MKRTQPLRAGDVLIYRVCEDVTEAIIYSMVVFSPWAFGTTQPWSVWTMNVAGFSLGALLIAKLAIRRLKGYRAPRWEGWKIGDSRSEIENGSREDLARSHLASPNSDLPSSNTHLLTHALAALTALILGYCLISAINARSTFLPQQLSFEYHPYLKWLPHSFDSGRTWFAFWNCLGLACTFWAVRDWLLGKSTGEERAGHQMPEVRRQKSEVIGTHTSGPEDHETTGPVVGGQWSVGSGPTPAPLLPARLRRLLWVLAINGGLLGLEGIAQRLEGSGRLLFLVRPQVNPEALSQFGPYAYRGSAASYFNLLWPVCLGFWWMLHRQAERQARAGLAKGPPRRHHLLLVCAAILAACPIISTSRGGALISVGMAILAVLLAAGGHFLFPARGRVRMRAHRRRTTGAPAGVIIHSPSNAKGPTSDIRHPTSDIQQSAAQAPHSGRERLAISGQKSEVSGPALALLAVCLIAALALGYTLGWKALKPRLSQFKEHLEGREQMYDSARPMAADYPLFGTGPGTFESVFQLYRISTETYWPAQLHNDWLETRITFGWFGSALIGLAFAVVILRWFAPGGIHGGRRFVGLTWLALAGCMAHARFDFPFQIYSILLLFLVLCAMLSTLSRR